MGRCGSLYSPAATHVAATVSRVPVADEFWLKHRRDVAREVRCPVRRRRALPRVTVYARLPVYWFRVCRPHALVGVAWVALSVTGPPTPASRCACTACSDPRSCRIRTRGHAGAAGTCRAWRCRPAATRGLGAVLPGRTLLLRRVAALAAVVAGACAPVRLATVARCCLPRCVCSDATFAKRLQQAYREA